MCRTTLSDYIFATKARINNRKKRKKIVKHQSSTCPHDMVNFSPLTAEIGSTIWGTPCKLLHDI